MSRTVLLATALSLLCAAASAQDSSSPSVRDFYVETRLAYEAENLSGDFIKSNTGFKGQWFNLRLDGSINDRLSYSWRHRLTKPTAATFLDATDWVHLDYKASDRLGLSAGKQVVAIGGFEYDRAPIDLYYCSEFWNNIPCYQLGVSAAYQVGENDNLMLQVCNSPYRSFGAASKLAYNLFWSSRHGFWQTLWSANVIGTNGDAINYISLGNRFHITESLHWDIDIMNRTAFGNPLFDDDWSVMTELGSELSDKAKAFVKFTHDRNSSLSSSDRLVQSGTDISMVSLGAEFFPLQNSRDFLKFFVIGGYRFGTNSNPAGTAMDKQLLVQAGLKWRMDILSGLRNK